MNIVSSHTVRMNQNILSGGRKIFVPLLKINLFKHLESVFHGKTSICLQNYNIQGIGHNLSGGEGGESGHR